MTTTLQQVPDSTIQTIREARNAGIINDAEKDEQIQTREEANYFDYLRKLIESGEELTKIRIKYFNDYKIGDIVTTNEKGRRMIGSPYTGIIVGLVSSTKRLRISLYKNGTSHMHDPNTGTYNFDYFDKVDYKMQRWNRAILFPPKTFIHMKVRTIAGAIKLIKDIGEVDSCENVEEKQTINGVEKKIKDKLVIKTKNMIFNYAGEDRELGHYEIEIDIKPKNVPWEMTDLTSHKRVVKTSKYIRAKRTEGFYPKAGKCTYNSFLATLASSEEGRFTNFCFGTSYEDVAVALKAGDYYAVAELIISTLVSNSGAGYTKWYDFFGIPPPRRE